MTVVHVPYVAGMLHPDTRRAVSCCGVRHEWHQLDRADPGGYGRLLRRLWAAKESVVIVEQDVVPTADQIAVLVDCGHRWCGYHYDDDRYPRVPMFGCVRLSGGMMTAWPSAADQASLRGPHKDREFGWFGLDQELAKVLHILGERFVWHEPPVRHLHDDAGMAA